MRIEKTVTNMRGIAFTIATIFLFCSCLKETSVDSFGTKSPTDSTTKDSCYLSKIIQGTNIGNDTIRVLLYDASKRLIKIIDSSDFVGGEDSLLFTYNASNQLTRIKWVALGSQVDITYSGARRVKMKKSYGDFTDDSAVYLYSYSTTNKPTKRTKFSYSDLSGETKVGDLNFEFDAYGDFIKLETTEMQAGYTWAKIEYYTDLNPFKLISETSEAWNYFGLAGGALDEIALSDHAPEYINFYDQNDELIRYVDFVYETDVDEKITKVTIISTDALDNKSIYTYRFEYKCK